MIWKGPIKKTRSLKKELEALRKPPKWVKANKNKNPDGSLKPGKKRGPKKGHKPHVRKVPEAVDEEVRWTPLTCEECESSLPAPVDGTIIIRWTCPCHLRLLGPSILWVGVGAVPAKKRFLLQKSWSPVSMVPGFMLRFVTGSTSWV